MTIDASRERTEIPMIIGRAISVTLSRYYLAGTYRSAHVILASFESGRSNEVSSVFIMFISSLLRNENSFLA